MAFNGKYQARFDRYNRENPEVAQYLVSYFMDQMQRGAQQLSINDGFEALRRHKAGAGKAFRLCNVLRAYYSRYLVAKMAELQGKILMKPSPKKKYLTCPECGHQFEKKVGHG